MPPKIVIHRTVKTTFKVNPRNGLLGGISRTFKRERMGEQVGELFDLLAQEMYADKTAFSYKSQFSLINVTNLLNGTSVGYSVMPPSEVTGFNSALVFTFSLVPSPYSNTLPSVGTKFKASSNLDMVTYWSTRKSGKEYLTISIDKATLRRLKLSFNTESEMVYMYNTIGALSKSFVLYNNWYRVNGTHESANAPTINEYTLYSKYYERSLKSMMNDHPMNTWLYCQQFWQQAQNLLTPQFLDIDEFGLFYLLYMIDDVPFSSSSTLFENLYSPVGGIRDYVAQGIKDFNLAMNNEAADITDNCYAVVHLIESMAYPGGLGIAVDKELAKRRMHQINSAFEFDDDLKTKFYSFMSDTNKAFIALIDRDSRFSSIVKEILL
ncbi:hypothetical protein BN7874_279 [Phage NCTB]|nr:hypothetical protein BN7874_279 [Phage NCTB]